jgi:glycine/D-amino acid oxidase-like deaminating enzyme
LPFRGSFHYDEGFYYFRSVGDRVLLGGGRNLAFDDERTASMDVTTTIQQALEHLLTTVIIPDRTVSIEYRWAGTMGFSATKHPRVAVTAAGYVQAFGCNGMGVAIGTTIAAQAANLVDAV